MAVYDVNSTLRWLAIPGALLLAALPVHAQTGAKPATEATIATNQAVLEELPFDDRTDFENVRAA